MTKQIAALALLTALLTTVAQAEVPTGFMKTWLLCGPFPNPPHEGDDIYNHTPPCVGLDTDYLTEHGGETKIVPKPGMTHTKKDGTKVAWFEHASGIDKVVFRKAITRTPNVVGYAFTSFTAKKAGRYLMSLGSDEGIRIWLNGELIHDKLVERPIRAGDDVVAIALRKGENRILVKVEQGWGGWGFIMELFTEDAVIATYKQNVDRLVTTATLTKRASERSKEFVLMHDKKRVAGGVFEGGTESGISRTTVDIPFPEVGTEYVSLDVLIEGRKSGEIEPPAVHPRRKDTFSWQGLEGKPGCVFSGTEFPGLDFAKPVWIERLIGPYTLEAAYYDADYNKVDSAEKPGRYGAVVKVETSEGTTYRYATLYRMAENVPWWDYELDVSVPELPEAMGIDTKVLEAQHDTIAQHMKWRLVSGFKEPDSAALFAALSEMSPDDPSTVARTDAGARDRRWWAGLKDRVGLYDQPHLVHLPENYDKDESKKWPLMLFLHGAGERGVDLEMLRRHGPPQPDSPAKDFPFIIISPQCPRSSWWNGQHLSVFLDRILEKYRVDRDRVYCTGLSMGGYGTWSLATERPEVFAAIAPICGGGDPKDAARIKDIPVWAFHGGKDTVVPPERTEVMIDAIKKLGGEPRYTLYPDEHHGSWVPAYKDRSLYEWLLSHKLSDRK